MSIWKKVRLYFAKRRLKKAYDNIQKVAASKLVLRNNVRKAQSAYDEVSDEIKLAFRLNPKEILEEILNKK